MTTIWLRLAKLGLVSYSRYRDLGDRERSEGNWAAAARLYAKHVRHFPHDFDIWVQLGHARKESGDRVGAYEAYMKALGLRADDADLLLNVGRLLRIAGSSKDSLEFFLKSSDVDGNPHAANELNEVIGDLPRSVASWILQLRFSDHADRVLRSGFHDPDWYRRSYPDVEASGLTPLQHYVRFGAYACRSPGPDFDSEWYLLQNPELLTATKSKCLDPLLHFLDFGQQQGRTPVCPYPTALAAARSAVEDVLDLEPCLYANEALLRSRQGKLKSLKIRDAIPRSQGFAAFKRVMSSLEKQYEYVITVPALVHGGAELMAMHMARAITRQRGAKAVLVLGTDSSCCDARDWLPPGVDFISMHECDRELEPSDTFDALLFILQAVSPKVVINVNSRCCWDVIRHYGNALSQFTSLYGCGFCRDTGDFGFPRGFEDTHVRDTLPWLTGLISDNAAFFQALCTQFLVPPCLAIKFITLYNPAPDQAAITTGGHADGFICGPSAKAFKVLWASRFTSQKNLVLLMKIAEAAPDIAFEVWGRGEGEAILRKFASSHANFRVMGPYASFDVLPVQEYGAFLYTSRWDGIPNVLLEAAASGLPLVSSAVGGIGELIDSETGYLIDDLDDPKSYLQALYRIRDAHNEATLRRDRMRKKLDSQHSWGCFIGRMERSGILTGRPLS